MLSNSWSAVQLIGSSTTTEGAARIVRAQEALMGDLMRATLDIDDSAATEDLARRLQNARLERDRLLEEFVDAAREDFEHRMKPLSDRYEHARFHCRRTTSVSNRSKSNVDAGPQSVRTSPYDPSARVGCSPWSTRVLTDGIRSRGALTASRSTGQDPHDCADGATGQRGDQVGDVGSVHG